MYFMKHLALFPEVKQTKLTKKMGQKPDRQSSSQQEQNKKKKMGELTSLATHVSIKHKALLCVSRCVRSQDI